MTDIVGRYGLHPNRGGFIRCPFHTGDHTASLKVYQDSFHCFGCGADGDIFQFVMLMEHIPFRDAFTLLGGTYDRTRNQQESRAKQLRLARAVQKRQAEEKEQKKKLEELRFFDKYLSNLQNGLMLCEPFSDAWCQIQNELPQTYDRWNELREEVRKNGGI